MTEPTDDHDHDGAWNGILIAFVVMFLFTFGTFIVQAHQFKVIYNRVGEMQRQLECPPGELFVTDHDGVEYCLNPEEESD